MTAWPSHAEQPSLPPCSTFCRRLRVDVGASSDESPAEAPPVHSTSWLPTGWSSLQLADHTILPSTRYSRRGSCTHQAVLLSAAPLPAQAVHSAAARALPHRQERISSDGAWWSGALAAPNPSSSSSHQPYVIGSATPGGLDTAPAVPLVNAETIDRLADLVQGARGTLVLTGAGCSTESGVPDYRGPAGAYTTSNFKPMTHQQASQPAVGKHRQCHPCKPQRAPL